MTIKRMLIKIHTRCLLVFASAGHGDFFKTAMKFFLLLKKSMDCIKLSCKLFMVNKKNPKILQKKNYDHKEDAYEDPCYMFVSEIFLLLKKSMYCIKLSCIFFLVNKKNPKILQKKSYDHKEDAYEDPYQMFVSVCFGGSW